MMFRLSFRWYGKDDPVSLAYIRQIPGMHSVVSAVYDVAPGEVWPEESIRFLTEEAARHGLVFDVVESVPVHEDIKLGRPTRTRYIENYKENIRRLGKAGVKVICYNFMPVFDWTRTDLAKKLPDGSTALVYYKEQLAKMDPLSGEYSLPGWDASYGKDELRSLFDAYSAVDSEKLWDNLGFFLREIIPAAEAAGVKMAIHPDDPPWPIFGLPRIVTNEENLERLLSLVDSEANGLTLCTGSLGSAGTNDVPAMVARFAAKKRIHFMHMRNVKLLDDGSFEESAHLSSAGSLDMGAIMLALYENGFDGYIRPDHGRMIWGETGRAGYGLYDRALGAAYLNGLWEGIARSDQARGK